MPGRQGIRAWREQIPLAGAPTSLGLPPRSSLSGSFPWCRGESRVRCSPAGSRGFHLQRLLHFYFSFPVDVVNWACIHDSIRYMVFLPFIHERAGS